MGCGAGALGSKVPVVQDDGVNKNPRCIDEPESSVPCYGAGLGWYNLKDDQLVTTAANAIPPGFDSLGKAAYQLQSMSEQDQKAAEWWMPTGWCGSWQKLVVDAVIADQPDNSRRYVNVVELAAARLNNSDYVIRGRIEKSSWRNQGDTWVSILWIRKMVGKRFLEQDWFAEPIDAAVANANEIKAPAMTFDAWKEAYMKKFLEHLGQEEQREKDALLAEDARAARTIKIYYYSESAAERGGIANMETFWSIQPAVIILDGTFTPNPQGGAPGERARTFDEAEASSAKAAFDASSYTYDKAYKLVKGPTRIDELKIEGTCDESTLACAMRLMCLI